jgi:hypothetical protein
MSLAPIHSQTFREEKGASRPLAQFHAHRPQQDRSEIDSRRQSSHLSASASACRRHTSAFRSKWIRNRGISRFLYSSLFFYFTACLLCRIYSPFSRQYSPILIHTLTLLCAHRLCIPSPPSFSPFLTHPLTLHRPPRLPNPFTPFPPLLPLNPLLLLPLLDP